MSDRDWKSGLPGEYAKEKLERLQKRGWVTSKWAETPTGRKARYYTITAAGRRQLGEEISSFDRVLAAIGRVMREA